MLAFKEIKYSFVKNGKHRQYKCSLFRYKRFILNLLLQRNASKLPYFCNPKTHIGFSPYESPGLCRHKVAQNEKKNYMGIRILKICQILNIQLSINTLFLKSVLVKDHFYTPYCCLNCSHKKNSPTFLSLSGTMR